MLALILGIIAIGEISSILIHVFMCYLGDYGKVLNTCKYDTKETLGIISAIIGWLVFPFFWYIAYKQLTLNK